LDQKPIKNFGKSSLGCSQGLPILFRAPIYREHRAVIFAIAQLSYIALQVENSVYSNGKRLQKAKIAHGNNVINQTE